MGLNLGQAEGSAWTRHRAQAGPGLGLSMHQGDGSFWMRDGAQPGRGTGLNLLDQCRGPFGICSQPIWDLSHAFGTYVRGLQAGGRGIECAAGQAGRQACFKPPWQSGVTYHLNLISKEIVEMLDD